MTAFVDILTAVTSNVIIACKVSLISVVKSTNNLYNYTHWPLVAKGGF